MSAILPTPAGSLLEEGPLRRALTLGIGQFAGHAVMLVSMPVLTRLYSPDDFGQFATYTAAMGIGSLVVTGHYESAIPLAQNRRQAFHLLVLTLSIVVMAAVCAGAAFLLVRDIPLVRDHAPQFRSLGLLMVANLAACGAYQALVYWLLHERQFGQLAIVRTMHGITTAAGQMSLGLLGPAGLIAGHGLGYGAAALWMGASACRQPGREPFTVVETVAAATRYSRFPAIGIWSTLISVLAAQLPALLLAGLFGPLDTGWYLLAHRSLTVPVSLLQLPVSWVFLRDAAEVSRTNLRRLPELYWRTVLGLIAVLALPLAAFWIGAPALFGWIFGTEWIRAGEFCRLIAPLVLAQISWNAVQPVLNVVSRQDLDFAISCLQIGLTAAGLLVPWYWGASADTAIASASIGAALGFVLSHIMASRCLSAHVARTHAAPIGPFNPLT